MKKINRTIKNALLVVLIIGLIFGWSHTVLAQGTVSGDKSLSATDIDCCGSTDVTLTLDAQTGIAGDPEDIMLVLDRSGSMSGVPIADLKVAANTFVDIIDEATDGQLDGVISYGSRIGVVSFASSASLDVALTTNANDVKDAINALTATGLTNHEAAIQMAQAELAGSMLDNTKQMIIFTDGQTTTGGNPDDDAAAARAAGTEIFAIGLGSVNVEKLNNWATDPDDEHVFIAPTSGDLQAIFEAIGTAIIVPAATNVQVVDTVNDHFIVSGVSASKGTVAQAGNILTWTIDELGTETVTLTYTATHDCMKAGGIETVNDEVIYSDNAGLTVTFPNPSVNVHGCAANIELDPPTETNELGTPGQTHTVTATVTDDFGDPVGDVEVLFEVISGPNTGTSGSGMTDSNGQATFTYEATQGLEGLGTDTIQATAPLQLKVSTELIDTANKIWEDTTPPVTECLETVNPHGKKVPPAGSTTLPGPKGGQNEDGFYELTATDLVDPDPQIFVVDTGSGMVFGPFVSGTKIKYTEAPGATPEQKTIGSSKGQAGAIEWHIIGNGDATLRVVDFSGNMAEVSCLIPPPPK